MSLLLSLLVGAVFVSGGVALGVMRHHAGAEAATAVQRAAGTGAASYMRVNRLAEMGHTAAGRSVPAMMADRVRRAAVRLRSSPCRALFVALVDGAWRCPGLGPRRRGDGGHLRRNLVVAGRSGGLGLVLPFRLPLERASGGASILYAQFPDALAMIVRAVRVGIPLSEGIHTVAREATPPTGPEFGLLYDRVAIGVTLEDALREMAGRNQLAEYRFFATALALQSRTGGGLTEALEGLADVMRRRLALKARGLALAAEAKTSIMILASLPFVSGGALGGVEPALHRPPVHRSRLRKSADRRDRVCWGAGCW